MSKRTRKNALWLGAQAAWGSLPVATYAPARALSVGFVQDGMSVLPTNYATGRNGPTPSERGADGATIQFELAVTGLSTAAGDGASPPTKDALDLVLDNAFGAAEEFVGEACAAGVSASSLELDTDVYDAQDLVPVMATGATALQWRRIADDSNPYALDRNFSPAPAENDIAYGSRQWTEPGSSGGGAYLTAYVEHDGACYLLRDGRVSAPLKLTVQAGQLWKLTVQITFDSKTRGTSAADLGVDALVDPIEGWSPSALKGVLSSVYWGSARLTKSIEIDFMPRTEPIPATAGTNGRGAIEVLQADATVAVEPLHDGALEDDFRAGTTAALTIQLGAGVPASGYVGSLCFFAEAAEIVGPVNITDDAGVQRTALKLAAVDTGAFAGAHRLWRLARA